MSGDFEILRPPKPPFWRDPKKRPKEIGFERFLLVSISFVSACLLFVPSRYGSLRPISLELADGNKSSWAMFGLLGLALAYLATKFVSAKRYVSSGLCQLAIVALSAIALTNPLSSNHLIIFVMLCLTLVVWLWSLYAEFEDAKLGMAAAMCTAGGFGCLISLGAGERMIALSALFGINIVFYGYVLI